MYTLAEIASFLSLEYKGDPDTKIYRISSEKNPTPNSITYYSNSKKLMNLSIDSNIVLIPTSLKNSFKLKNNVIFSPNPPLDFAKITNKFAKSKFPNSPRTTLSSFDNSISFGLNVAISKGVKIGKNCKIGNNVVIEQGVSIGDDVFLEHNVVIHQDSIIGNNVSIGSSSIIGSEGFGNTLDQNGAWHHISHLGLVRIHNNVSIGANCTIDRGTIDETIIHQGVIIDNQVHIAHNVVIGENTAIAAKVGIAGSCFIGKRNMIGGMVGIIDHIKTADDVIISATSTVHKDIKEPGTYTGIMPFAKHSRWKRIALWITKLDKIANFLNLKKI